MNLLFAIYSSWTSYHTSWKLKSTSDGLGKSLVSTSGCRHWFQLPKYKSGMFSHCGDSLTWFMFFNQNFHSFHLGHHPTKQKKERKKDMGKERRSSLPTQSLRHYPNRKRKRKRRHLRPLSTNPISAGKTTPPQHSKGWERRRRKKKRRRKGKELLSPYIQPLTPPPSLDYADSTIKVKLSSPCPLPFLFTTTSSSSIIIMIPSHQFSKKEKVGKCENKATQ